MPTRTARRSSNHHSSVAPDDDESMRAGSVEASEAEDPKYILASSFLGTMMREIIIDTALQAHRSARRRRRAEGEASVGCPVCKKSCQAPSFGSHGNSDTGKSDVGGEGAVEGMPSAGEGSETQAKGLEIYNHNPLLQCVVCSRQVSANRYAQHLASCVGVGKGAQARRKGKMGGASKIKTALENRRRAGYLMSGTSTPIQRTLDDAMSATSDDEGGRKKSNLSNSFTLNGNGKRSASPMEAFEGSKKQKAGTPPRSSESGFRTQQMLGVPSLSNSQPIAASPLNPHRNAQQPISIDDDDEYEGGSEEGEVKDISARARVRSASLVSGAEDGSSDVYVQDTGSEQNYESEDDGSVRQNKGKRNGAPGNAPDSDEEEEEEEEEDEEEDEDGDAEEEDDDDE